RNVLYDGRNLSGLQFGVYGAVCALLLLTWRLSFRSALRYVRSRGWNLRHVAIIGTDRLGQVVYRTFDRNSWTGVKPGFFISHHPTTMRESCFGLPVRGGLNDLEKTLEGLDLSGVIIALPA